MTLVLTLLALCALATAFLAAFMAVATRDDRGDVWPVIVDEEEWR